MIAIGEPHYVSMGQLVKDEGRPIGNPSNYLVSTGEDCGRICGTTIGCNSFGFCHERPGVTNCYLHDKYLTGSEEFQPIGNCESWREISGKI